MSYVSLIFCVIVNAQKSFLFICRHCAKDASINFTIYFYNLRIFFNSLGKSAQFFPAFFLYLKKSKSRSSNIMLLKRSAFIGPQDFSVYSQIFNPMPSALCFLSRAPSAVRRVPVSNGYRDGKDRQQPDQHRGYRPPDGVDKAAGSSAATPAAAGR